MKYRNIPLEKLLIVSDDLDLPAGRIRLKTSGGSGGHHGLDSIISHLQNSAFSRLRIGVGKPPSAEEGVHHVLASFTPEEKSKIDAAIERARDGIELFVLKGAETAMNELNRDIEAEKSKEKGKDEKV